ncbi:hypothetical protein CAMGR0001_1800 [Campylobacter gracilis RM3268]|uniref:Uncharacterized protein n=1 Tax=Campylobacter gracilis RM3268 TaxID=553220 RepID=C8PK90_9BACT|nr:hypothetical protein CAMGR0001_1800 [Campylobacter gracilis RM3268]
MGFLCFSVPTLRQNFFQNAKVRIKYIRNFQHEIFGKKAKLARSWI